MQTQWITVDGNEAAARVAYHLSDIIAIYPITPSRAPAVQTLADGDAIVRKCLPPNAQLRDRRRTLLCTSRLGRCRNAKRR